MVGFWQRYTQAMVAAARRYSAHRFGPRAQAIAYNVLLSLIPLVATAVAVFGLVLRDDQTRRRVTDALIRSLAVATGNTGFIRETTDVIAASSRAVGPLSLALALWTAMRVLRVVHQALEDAWGDAEQPPLLHRRLLEAVMIAAVVALLLASTVVSAVFGALIALGSDVFGPDTPGLRLLAAVGGVGLAIGLTIAAFVLTYRFVPGRGQSWRAALAGGVPAGLAFEALRLGFTVFVTHFAGVNVVYGALSSVFLFLAWANLAASILLLGAELTVVWERSSGGRTLQPLSAQIRKLKAHRPGFKVDGW